MRKAVFAVPKMDCTAEESLVFALPKELRRDLKAAGRS